MNIKSTGKIFNKYEPFMAFDWLKVAKEIQAIAQAGLTYSENKYDIDRYRQLRELSVQILKEYTDAPVEKIRHLFANEEGYQTPKVDIRSVVFRDGRILMVRESIDGLWTLPGGWADVNYSPFEVAAKEVLEEAGIHVKPQRLLAVFDKMKHLHPPDIYHVYKLFILCLDSGEAVKPGLETIDAAWVDRNTIPPLSLLRITKQQIELMFEYYDNPKKDALCD
jgi:ADP-ribose pyrophosphatase YjhB (NUDIX family)